MDRVFSMHFMMTQGMDERKLYLFPLYSLMNPDLSYLSLNLIIIVTSSARECA